MKKIALYLLAAFSMYACKQQNRNLDSKTQTTNAELDTLYQKLDSISENGPMVGFSVALLDKDKVLFNEGFGFANAPEQQKYTAQTVQNIGSISKTFIGIALLKAQELGKLKLDDPVNNHLPFKVVNPKYPDSLITLRQLATHTSSILDTEYYGYSYVLLDSVIKPNEVSMDYFNPPASKMPMGEYLEKLVGVNGQWNADSFADYCPGKTYEYSNIAATLAAYALEHTMEMPFDQFTQKHILDPLAMDSSGWKQSSIEPDARSRSYISADTLIAPYELITYPDGGFITSSEDLSKYLMELMKGKAGQGTLLSTTSYQELFAAQLAPEQLTEDADEENSGIFMEFSERGLGHSGGDPGIVAFMYFNPETNFGKIAMQNTDYDDNRQVILDYIEVWKLLEAFEKDN